MKLNCDMGEGLASDADVMPYIQQANIACGGHIGDLDSMRHTVELAMAYDVSVGAHPAYPDRENFGRVSIEISNEALESSLLKQMNDLRQVCTELNTRISYVKPHGALNNDMVVGDKLFNSICATIARFAPNMPIMVQMTSRKETLADIAQSHGLPVIWEIFADRAYEADGTLRNRKNADAVHQDPAQIVAQVKEIESAHRVPIYNSSDFYSVDGASTICIHGDNPASVAACPQIAEILALHGAD